MIKEITMISGIAFLSSCASNPDNISAAYVSPLQYASYNCNQIAQEMIHVSERTNTLYGRLKDKRSADNWQMGVGLVVFWPTLFALEGGDGPEATEYAQIKGEYEALRVNSVEKNCNLELRTPDEVLEDARREDENSDSQSGGSTLSNRLQELDQLRNEDAITEEEYQAARQAALGI